MQSFRSLFTATSASATLQLSRVAALAALLWSVGCDDFPKDAAGALKRAQSGGELRVGAVENPPWVRWEDDRPVGLEPELVEQWAQGLGAKVTWQRGGIAELVEALHRREIEVLIGGLKRDTPYGPEIALTEAYTKVRDRHGKVGKHAMGVTQGENALLLSLDRFLLAQDAEALRARAAKEGGAP